MSSNAASFDEARWRRLTDAEAAEEVLSDADREFLAAFVPESREAQAEAELFLALVGLGDDDERGVASSPLVNATVQHVRAANHPPAPPSVPFGWARSNWPVEGEGSSRQPRRWWRRSWAPPG